MDTSRISLQIDGTPSGRSDISAKVAEAKQKVQQLKAEISGLREGKNCGGVMESVIEGTSLKHAGPPPRLRRLLKGHYGKVYSMAWAGDENTLVSASQDGNLLIWDAYSENKRQSIALRSSWVMACTFEQLESQLVACGGLDNNCSIYRVGSSQAQITRPIAELRGHDGYLSCCRFITESNMVTSSGDATCIHWDVERTSPIRSFNDHAGDVMGLSINPIDSNMFASGSCDSTAKVWDLRTGEVTHTFQGHDSDVNAIDFYPDGNAVGTVSDDSTCRIFDLRSYSEVNVFSHDLVLTGSTSVAFSRSGRFVFTGYDDFNCYAWDTFRSGANSYAWKLSDHANRVSCVGVNLSGKALCTGSWDSMLRVWA